MFKFSGNIGKYLKILETSWKYWKLFENIGSLLETFEDFWINFETKTHKTKFHPMESPKYSKSINKVSLHVVVSVVLHLIA